MAIHDFIQRQQELIQQLNTLITNYEQEKTDAEARFAREIANCEKWRDQKLVDIEKPMEELRKLKGPRRMTALEGGTPQAGKLTISNDLANFAQDMANCLSLAKDSNRIIEKTSSIEATVIVTLTVATFIAFLGLGLIWTSILWAIVCFLLVLLLIVGAVYMSMARVKKRKNAYATLLYAVSSAESAYQQQVKSIKSAYQAGTAEAEGAFLSQIGQLEQAWSAKLAGLKSMIGAYTREAGLSGADWRDPSWRLWKPSSAMVPVTRLGSLAIDYSNLRIPPLPLFIPFPGERNLLLKTTSAVQSEATAAIQSLVLRLFATQPPGMIRFTFIDTAGFGRSIAPFMQLANVDESLVTGRIWTEASHIEKQLADLSEYMTMINQKYLWGPYTTIEDYNEKNRNSPLPYRILVVLGFPYKFTPETARTLLNIAKNGPPCGVCVAVVWDTEQRLIQGFNVPDLERVSTVIAWQGQQIIWEGIKLEKQVQAAFAL